MGKRVYYFGDFRLDPVARELSRNGEPITIAANAFACLVYLIEHRERAVGKDELVSAVWGRVDVSDNLLAQTIVRLRRALGDVSPEQRCIKTMPRVGYRWMLDTVVGDAPDDTAEQARIKNENTQPEAGATPTRALSRSPWLRRSLWMTSLLVLVAVVVCWRWSTHHKRVSFSRGTAIVLPAEVNAPEDWKWLHLGLMDLISNDLREAKVPVESSQTVLDLLNEPDTNGGQRFAAFALVIRPRVALVDNAWQVHLDASSPNGRTWQAESSMDSVLKAARSAETRLLAQMGIAAAPGKPVSDDEKQEYLMSIEAATYAGSGDVVRELLDKAPPAVREMPEYDYEKAAFHCNQGEYELCKQGLADLLQRLPADKQPVLRGRVLAQQYYVYFREHDYAGGEAALNEAVQLLQKQKNATYLAFAYAQRGELALADGKFDQAQSDFGLARVNYALDGYTVAALGMDASLARLAMQRGQFAQALPVLQRAYDEYQRMGMRQFIPDLFQDMVVSRRMLLQYADELAVADSYWPFEEKHWDIPDDVTRHVLVYERARALADNGRTTEATSLLEHLLGDIQRDPAGEPGLQDVTYILLAKLALQRGDIQASQAWIAKALVPQLLQKGNDKRDYADALLTNVMVMQRAGKTKELKDGVAAMQAWVAGAPDKDEWIAILLLRAQAVEAWSEGHHDQALAQWKLAMSKADEFGVPELIVDIGQAYTQALLAAGNVEEAASVSGKLSTWGQLDWRAAWAQACVYRALGQMAYWEQYRNKARQLAGDRALPADASVFVY
ncbi:winged helix-turn-helix domain-containing protein [Dyella nitratireducens]|uniref:OmpR/PhoB-type domain-containing protein n=1 Tax=Dyella nitratireducens TaxID=1849580 RepID=A0ABQ1G745_9GAMM|nr:winged helix-turn-helix domain-containing protein [Dyella nitratireducens]GGA37882.1 hypothetical protein GCM10010981_28810 [Dyella nitratireducens]GLQ40240.1 hypothetical protein GCM10007902_00890 [Dyella nitratireducens]